MTTQNELRIKKLAEKGIDTSKYFTVSLPNGNEAIMTMNDAGVPEVVNIKDDIETSIIENGYVRNTKLHRRWIMAQTFRMLNHKGKSAEQDGYNDYLHKYYGYMYQFKMTLDELKVLAEIYKDGDSCYYERSTFFTKDVVVALCDDYIEKLKRIINAKKVKHCKGIPYVTIKHKDYFVVDLDRKFYKKYENALYKIENSCDVKDLYYNFKHFYSLVKNIQIPYNAKKCNAWVSAFKGAGGYYTLKNMLMYHDCYIVSNETGEVLKGDTAISYIDSFLQTYKGCGWRYLAMLRQCISDNNFTFK